MIKKATKQTDLEIGIHEKFRLKNSNILIFLIFF